MGQGHVSCPVALTGSTGQNDPTSHVTPPTVRVLGDGDRRSWGFRPSPDGSSIALRRWLDGEPYWVSAAPKRSPEHRQQRRTAAVNSGQKWKWPYARSQYTIGYANDAQAHQELEEMLGEDGEGRNRRRFDAELRPEMKMNGWFLTMETFPSRFLPPRGPRQRGWASWIPIGSSGDLKRRRGSMAGARVLATCKISREKERKGAALGFSLAAEIFL
jgi:hypothetical protein